MTSAGFAPRRDRVPCRPSAASTPRRRGQRSRSFSHLLGLARLSAAHIPAPTSPHAPATSVSPSASSPNPASLAASAPAVAQLKFPSHTRASFIYEQAFRRSIARPFPTSDSPTTPDCPSSTMADFPPSRDSNAGDARHAVDTADDLRSYSHASSSASASALAATMRTIDDHDGRRHIPHPPALQLESSTPAAAETVNSNPSLVDGGTLHEPLPTKHRTASAPPLSFFIPYSRRPSASDHPASIPSSPPVKLPPTPPDDNHNNTVDWDALSSRRRSSSSGISPTHELPANESVSTTQRSASTTSSYSSSKINQDNSPTTDNLDANWKWPSSYPVHTASAPNTGAMVTYDHNGQDAETRGHTASSMCQRQSLAGSGSGSSRSSMSESGTEYDAQEWLAKGILSAVSHLRASSRPAPVLQVVSQTMPGPATTSPESTVTVSSSSSSLPSLNTPSLSRKSDHQEKQLPYQTHIPAFSLILESLFSHASATRSSYVTITHALSPNSPLSGLPPVSPLSRSTLSPLLTGNGDDDDDSRDSYFAAQQRVFATATPAPSYEESTASSPTQQSQQPSRRHITPPLSVDVAAIERYIPSSSAQEYKNLFSGDADSYLVDRLGELHAPNADGEGGSLVLIYPTKRGGQTFQRSYLSPVYDPVIRQLIVGKGMSSDVGSQLGKIPSVGSLEDFEVMKEKLEATCAAFSERENNHTTQRGTDRVPDGDKGNSSGGSPDDNAGAAEEISVTYASKGHIRLSYKIWTEWYIEQDFPRARRLLNTHQRPSYQQYRMDLPPRTQSCSQTQSAATASTHSPSKTGSLDSTNDARLGSSVRPGLLSSKITDEEGLPMNLNLSLNMNMNDWATPHPTVMKPGNEISSTTLLQALADGLRGNSSYRQEKQGIESERMEIGVFVIQRRRQSRRRDTGGD